MVTSGELSIRRAAEVVQPTTLVAPACVVETLDRNAFVIIRAGGNKAMKQHAVHSCSVLQNQALRSPAQSFREIVKTERESNGFLLDYVIHGEGGVQGSHCIEVVLRAVDLTWPYMHDLSLVWQIVEVYSHFVFIDYVCPFIVDAGKPWFFVNVVLTEGHLLAISPQAGCLSSPGGCPTSWVPAVLCQWDRMRIGYDWAGQRESVLIVNAQGLCTKLLKDVHPELIQSSWQLRLQKWSESSIVLPVDVFLRWQVSSQGAQQATDTVDSFPPESVGTGRSQSGYVAAGDDSDAAETTSKSSLHVACGRLQLQLATSISQHLKSFSDVLRRVQDPAADASMEAMRGSLVDDDEDDDDKSDAVTLAFPPASHKLAAVPTLSAMASELSSQAKSVGSKKASAAGVASRRGNFQQQDRKDDPPQATTWLKAPKVYDDLCGPPRVHVKSSSQPVKTASRRVSTNSQASRCDCLSKQQFVKNLWSMLRSFAQLGCMCCVCRRSSVTPSAGASDWSSKSSRATGRSKSQSVRSLQV